MKKYSHNFVEEYNGFIGFGWDRQSDENTVICYLQMFSDDGLMKKLISKLSDDELEEIYSMINRLMKAHLNESEYHRLFLKEDHH
ncbi:MAG: cytoplasmic protein [Desulfobacteraceae bacterium]|jgi:hypothetical protein|nr:cytoplasmic protein [Desulfobacteraceae bacterium]